MMIRVGVVEQRAFLSVLQRIETHAKTGLLTLIYNEQEAELYFQQGQLTSISLKKAPSLGERLVQARVISQDDLQEALLTLITTDDHSLAAKDRGDVLMARTLLELGLLRREQLSAWTTQEAVEILQDLLTWSESEVSFVEGVSAPLDRLSLDLDHRVTALILSLSNQSATSHLSSKVSTSVRGKLSLPTIPTTPSFFKKVEPAIKGAPRVKTSPPSLSGLIKTSIPGIRKFSLPLRPLSTEHNPSVERFPTLAVEVLKRDPHLEKFNTVSITALKAITHPKRMKNLKIRISGGLFVVGSLFYIPWQFEALNTHALWFALPFLSAALYIHFFLLISIYNNWNRSVPKLFKLPDGVEPVVAILIPTYGELAEMVQKTIESVLHQNWPHEAMLIIVGDDGHNPKMQYMVENLQRNYPSARMVYHLPPSKNSPERMGKAKDGNLNSMLKLVSQQYPEILYVETRDADDLVGSGNFLRYTVGHLVSNPKAAYVQTIKEAMVSPGDPFGNMQAAFYRGLLLSKHATNSVFPCGSGLVWSKQPLDEIGGFPTWNLVEDLYSGYVAMQHGFKGSYLPIVGAIGQVAPEDIPNLYKQLGTWALDTIRMFVWQNPWRVKGLTFQQRMHFTEMGLWYLSSFAQLILFLTPPICLFSGAYPLRSHDFVIFLVVLFVHNFIIDAYLLFLGHDITLKDNWKAKQQFAGMMFVYMKAALLAVVYGPHKKPVYKVTRKVQIVGLYVKEVFFQIVLFLFLVSSIVYDFETHQANIKEMDFGSIAWVVFYMVLLSGIISKSWYGVKLSQLAKSENGKSRF